MSYSITKSDSDTVSLGTIILSAISCVAIPTIGLVLVSISKQRSEIDKIREQSKFPPEYWTAKAESARASIEKHRIDKDMEKQLTIDARNRDDARRKQIMEFEQNAPKEYWDHKRVLEIEKTKRDAELKRAEAERYSAQQNAEAIKSSAQTLGKALSHNQY